MPILKLEVELSDEAFERAMAILGGNEAGEAPSATGAAKRGRKPKADKPEIEVPEELPPISLEDLSAKIKFLTETMDKTGFQTKLPVQNLGGIWQTLGITDPSVLQTDETLRRRAYDELSKYDAN